MDVLQGLLVCWKDEYSVNIDSIDTQHKMLVAMIRQLQEAMLDGRARQIQRQLLTKLNLYITYHLQFEETLMSNCSYKQLLSHQRRHREMADRVRDLEQQLDDGKTIKNSEMLRFLRDWLIEHIMKLDKHFGNDPSANLSRCE